MTQKERLKAVLDDGKPHRTDELLERVYGAAHLGIARLGARVYEVRESLPSTKQIRAWKDKVTPSLTWYQLVDAPPEASPQLGLFDGTVGVA